VAQPIDGVGTNMELIWKELVCSAVFGKLFRYVRYGVRIRVYIQESTLDMLFSLTIHVIRPLRSELQVRSIGPSFHRSRLEVRCVSRLPSPK